MPLPPNLSNLRDYTRKVCGEDPVAQDHGVRIDARLRQLDDVMAEVVATIKANAVGAKLRPRFVSGQGPGEDGLRVGGLRIALPALRDVFDKMQNGDGGMRGTRGMTAARTAAVAQYVVACICKCKLTAGCTSVAVEADVVAGASQYADIGGSRPDRTRRTMEKYVAGLEELSASSVSRCVTYVHEPQRDAVLAIVTIKKKDNQKLQIRLNLDLYREHLVRLDGSRVVIAVVDGGDINIHRCARVIVELFLHYTYVASVLGKGSNEELRELLRSFEPPDIFVAPPPPVKIPVPPVKIPVPPVKIPDPVKTPVPPPPSDSSSDTESESTSVSSEASSEAPSEAESDVVPPPVVKTQQQELPPAGHSLHHLRHGRGATYKVPYKGAHVQVSNSDLGDIQHRIENNGVRLNDLKHLKAIQGNPGDYHMQGESTPEVTRATRSYATAELGKIIAGIECDYDHDSESKYTNCKTRAGTGNLIHTICDELINIGEPPAAFIDRILAKKVEYVPERVAKSALIKSIIIKSVRATIGAIVSSNACRMKPSGYDYICKLKDGDVQKLISVCKLLEAFGETPSSTLKSVISAVQPPKYLEEQTAMFTAFATKLKLERGFVLQ